MRSHIFFFMRHEAPDRPGGALPRRGEIGRGMHADQASLDGHSLLKRHKIQLEGSVVVSCAVVTVVIFYGHAVSGRV